MNKNNISVLFFHETGLLPPESFYQEVCKHGYELVGKLSCDTDIIAESLKHNPDLLVFNLGSMAPEILFSLNELKLVSPKPIIVFSSQESPDAMKEATLSGVSAYVVGTMDHQRFKSVAHVALIRFEEYRKLSSELAQTKCKLADRKLIDKAKGLLMEHQSMTEDIAFKHLRKSAMNKGQTLAEASQSIIDVLALFDRNNIV